MISCKEKIINSFFFFNKENQFFIEILKWKNNETIYFPSIIIIQQREYIICTILKRNATIVTNLNKLFLGTHT
jgi:hypothetical protein